MSFRCFLRTLASTEVLASFDLVSMEALPSSSASEDKLKMALNDILRK